MIQIVENIQTLHNSLASDIVENSLSARIVHLETGDFEITSEDSDDDNYKDILASIGELYATLTNVDGQKEDSKCLDPRLSRKSQAKESSELITDLETVVEFSNLEDRQGKSYKKSGPAERFRLTQKKKIRLLCQPQ
jgi:hypothetical protein